MVGTKLGHYRIKRQLGAGGMGVVYEAEDERLGRDVALKFVKDSPAAGIADKEQLLAEARAAAKLDHPNIGAIYAIEDNGGVPFIVLALYRGLTLTAKLETGPLAPHEALEFCLQAARGVGAAHAQRLIHRDIKPANLFLTTEGLVKVLDFGLARGDGIDQVSIPGRTVGTFAYMAPEQVRGQRIDHRADLWALGAVLYEMLCGAPPFPTEGGLASAILSILQAEPVPPSALRPGLPNDLDLIVLRALAKDAKERYQSAAELIGDLEELTKSKNGGARQSQLALQATGIGAPTQLLQPVVAATQPERGETPANPHVLPAPTSPIVGRLGELSIISLHLQDAGCRILTLFGPGGTGKTRLAVEAAHIQARTAFSRVCFLPLESLTRHELILGELARTLGVEAHEDHLLARIAAHIGDTPTLIVLDNFEHLTAGAIVAAELVLACPNLKLLVTSRERLQLEEEWVLPVQGLELSTVERAGQEGGLSDAVQLFLQRARRASVGFAPDHHELSCIGEICSLVHGSPLGIELAAAWVRQLSLEEVHSGIKENLDFLTSSSRNRPERHKSIRATFEYSWALLTQSEQDILAALSVCLGGFDRDVAAEVAGAGHSQLAALVDKSLLQSASGGRYELHPLLKRYAAEKLQATTEAHAQVQQQHGRYFHRLLHSQREALRGTDQEQALAVLERNLDNIRVAWRWAVDHGRVSELHQSERPLSDFFDFTGRYSEGAEAFTAMEQGLSEDDAEHRLAIGHARLSQAWFLYRMGRYAEAAAVTVRAMEPIRSLGDHGAAVRELNLLGSIAYRQGEYAQAAKHWQELLDAVTANDNRNVRGIALGHVAIAEGALGNHDTARELLEQALAINRELTLKDGIITNLQNLAGLELSSGNPDQAHAYLLEGLELARRGGIQSHVPYLLSDLSAVCMSLAQPDAARAYADEALALARETSDQALEAHMLAELGKQALAVGDSVGAREHFSRGLRLSWPRRDLPGALRNVAGMAELYAQMSRATDAAALLGIVAAHHATLPPDRDHAKQLLAALGAVEHGTSGHSLDEAVASLLSQREGLVAEVSVRPGAAGEEALP